jgi:hypothetical protein
MYWIMKINGDLLPAYHYILKNIMYKNHCLSKLFLSQISKPLLIGLHLDHKQAYLSKIISLRDDFPFPLPEAWIYLL